MRSWYFPLLIVLFLIAFSTNAVDARQALPTPLVTALPESTIQIISPKPGQALQGSIPVIVDTTTEGFQTVELTFGYAGDESKTWFLIKQGIQPVTGTMLTLWDTGVLTDGDYALRMEVTFKDGQQKSVIVPGLRVRNYSPVETETPLPIPPTATPAPARTPTPTIAPTQSPLAALPLPTSLPKNPAELGRQEIFMAAGKGILAIIGVFAIGGIFNGIRRLVRKK